MNKLLDVLGTLTYSELKSLWARHLLWSKENDRVSGKPKWYDEPGTLNIIGIRCNSEVDFNYGAYNDYLILIMNKADGCYDQVIIPVTVDPNHDEYGRGHLSQGVYDSYCIGIHGLSSGNTSTLVAEKKEYIPRYAIRQDRGPVFVTRTDGKGKVIKREWCMAYINIHDPNKYRDSGIACTVIQTVKLWFYSFLPYIWNYSSNEIVPSNAASLVYCLINHTQLETYLGEELERVQIAEAIEGEDKSVSIEPKGATREGVVK
ncbi:MAG: hypothetical protein IAE90_07455 [Ignavibacteria bacterium]|nr:hypothetical protein [Ignavibacteria bacterium]